jgi:hypothetical protein
MKMSWLRRTDQAAGGAAAVLTTLGQLALVLLGVHIATDHIDDPIAAGIAQLLAGADRHLAPPLMGAAEALGLGYADLLFWTDLSAPVAAAWCALTIELVADVALGGSFLLTPRTPTLSWTQYRETLSLYALALPPALLGVLIAGSWSLSMAAEDLLPASAIAPWAAGLLGLAALARFGGPALRRAVAALPTGTPPLRRSLRAVLVMLIGSLAWAHGAPVWGWL